MPVLTRGPYQGRKAEYAAARKLRTKGFGYRTIANEINVCWSTVANWVSDIECDRSIAYEEAARRRKIPADKLRHPRARLLEERGNRCEQCGTSEWNGQQLSIELHHIDGNKRNNRSENLQLLCPNCHSLTPNFRNKRPPSPTVETSALKAPK